MKVMPGASDEGSRGRRGRRISTTLSEINVIPLVDVMLVLLIIFMVAAPMLQRGVEVNLPAARQSQKMTAVRMYITIPVSYRKDRKVFIDDESVSVDFLAERIRQSLIGQDERDVYLRGDGGVLYQEVFEVMDRLKEGGIEKVGLVALQKGN
jgi:biopolymer transport protein TolR